MNEKTNCIGEIIKIRKVYMLFLIILLQLNLSSNGQRKVSISIYKHGKPLVDCESNFENLIYNWNEKIVTNAGEFESIEYEFVETIVDSATINYYRNYFTGIESVGFTKSVKRASGSELQDNFYELIVKPGYRKKYSMDRLSKQEKEELDDEFIRKANHILTHNYNIDELELNNVYASFERKDTTWGTINGKRIAKSIGRRARYHNKYHLDTVSDNYIKVYVTREKEYCDLGLKERQELALEGIFIERISWQVSLSKRISLGDKVYCIKFKHLGKEYKNYVICSARTNEVIVDKCFKNIKIDLK